MLSSIFVSDVEDIEPDNASLAQAPLAKTSEGQPTQQLHEGYHTLYSEIISQDTWSREVLEARCDALNVLMDGALEIINDWSFECVDAPLLEGDDPIYVDLDIVTEIDELGLNPKDSKG